MHIIDTMAEFADAWAEDDGYRIDFKPQGLEVAARRVGHVGSGEHDAMGGVLAIAAVQRWLDSRGRALSLWAEGMEETESTSESLDRAARSIAASVEVLLGHDVNEADRSVFARGVSAYRRAVRRYASKTGEVPARAMTYAEAKERDQEATRMKSGARFVEYVIKLGRVERASGVCAAASSCEFRRFETYEEAKRSFNSIDLRDEYRALASGTPDGGLEVCGVFAELGSAVGFDENGAPLGYEEIDFGEYVDND